MEVIDGIKIGNHPDRSPSSRISAVLKEQALLPGADQPDPPHPDQSQCPDSGKRSEGLARGKFQGAGTIDEESLENK